MTWDKQQEMEGIWMDHHQNHTFFIKKEKQFMQHKQKQTYFYALNKYYN